MRISGSLGLGFIEFIGFRGFVGFRGFIGFTGLRALMRVGVRRLHRV